MTKPNIILILTDHFRRDALGPGTPDLQALAAEGTQFGNAYCAAPLCQPARCSIITGTYPSLHGVCGNQSTPIQDRLRDATFMNQLRDAGYYTAMVGKHHYIDRYGLGVDVREDDDELKRYGFDRVFQVVDDGENMHNTDEYTAFLKDAGKLDEFRNGFKEKAWCFGPHPFPDDETADGFIGINGIRFVEEYDDAEPFYLNLSFIGPHPPFWHPGELQHDPDRMPAALGVPDTSGDRERRAHYMDKCALIDRYVGRLASALKEKGIYDNTVIIFTSDHGENAGDYGIWDKRFFYEQSCGVPLILAGPGIPRQERMNGPRRSKALVSHLDLFPTILALAGVSPQPSRARPGRDLVQMLHDVPGSGHPEIHAQLGTAVMIRTGNWKLVFDPEAGGIQYFFNLAVDPEELSNLAGVPDYEHVALDLVQRILSHRIRTTQFTHAKEEQRVQRVRTI